MFFIESFEYTRYRYNLNKLVINRIKPYLKNLTIETNDPLVYFTDINYSKIFFEIIFNCQNITNFQLENSYFLYDENLKLLFKNNKKISKITLINKNNSHLSSYCLINLNTDLN